ncbi:MAG: PAS domain S-box protein, partial [Actinomycetota bacterium]|nr:PAS domain S-box protein [Actinomycetota bacterium]
GYDRGYETPVVLIPLDGRDPRAHTHGGTQRPLFGRKRNDGPQRELREGFDDAGRPMATVELNGHFRELNRAFSDLVGYSEEEFQAALWPPVMDGANLPKHREQMNHLLAARISSADFDTGYVHAQGLLVPLAGTITLVKREGNPDHFLLDVQAPG